MNPSPNTQLPVGAENDLGSTSEALKFWQNFWAVSWVSSKNAKQLAQLGLASVVALAGLTACDQRKNDEQQKQQVGGLTNEGNSVSSSTPIAGYAASINALELRSATNNSMNPWNIGGPSMPLLSFRLSVNGQVVVPQMYATLYGQGSMGPTYHQSAVGGMWVAYEAACYQPSCEDALLYIRIHAPNPFFGIDLNRIDKQIAIRWKIRDSRVMTMTEQNNAPPRAIDQWMRELM